SFDHRPTVPGTLAGGIVLPVDQTASAHPSFLRHLRERREDPSVGGPLGLYPGSHRQKAIGAGTESPPNSPNSQCHDFRKNPDFRGVFQFQRRLLRRGDLYPIEPFRLTLGRYWDEVNDEKSRMVGCESLCPRPFGGEGGRPPAFSSAGAGRV